MMGDFNDDPTDKSIAQGWSQFKLKDLKEGDFFFMPTCSKAGYGTLAYGDAWNIFDNIVASGIREFSKRIDRKAEITASSRI